jgi:hypothetical protein
MVYSNAPLPSIEGSIATMWLIPSGIPGTGNTWDGGGKGGNLTFWNNSAWWDHYEMQRDNDVKMLKRALGNHPNATVILAFDHYLADESAYGNSALQRLVTVVRDFSSHGIKTMVFFLDVEFYGAGTWKYTHDVVHNVTARSYLLANINRTLSLPGMESVAYASSYWVGASSRCNGKQSTCSEEEITDFIQAVQNEVNFHGKRYLLHVDGPFWDGCWPQPCDPDKWVIGGYSPNSLRAAKVQGLLGESWVMGSLKNAVELLVGGTSPAVPRSEVMLLADIPNCDDPAVSKSHPCSTGSLTSDVNKWFAIVDSLGMGSTWGSWDFVDGGLSQANPYGVLCNNGTVLTPKGELMRTKAMQSRPS